MSDFEVRYQRDPNAKVKTVRIKAVSAEAAKAAAERMMRLAGAKKGKVISVREVAPA